MKCQQGKKRRLYRRKKQPYQKKSNRNRLRKLGDFLNRYDFAYAGRDVVNQAAKVTSDVIKVATKDINAAATDRIN